MTSDRWYSMLDFPQAPVPFGSRVRLTHGPNIRGNIVYYDCYDHYPLANPMVGIQWDNGTVSEVQFDALTICAGYVTSCDKCMGNISSTRDFDTRLCRSCKIILDDFMNWDKRNYEEKQRQQNMNSKMTNEQRGQVNFLTELGHTAQQIFDAVLEPEQKTAKNMAAIKIMMSSRKIALGRENARNLKPMVYTTRQSIPDIDVDFSDALTDMADVVIHLQANEQRDDELSRVQPIQKPLETRPDDTIEPGPKKRRYT